MKASLLGRAGLRWQRLAVPAVSFASFMFSSAGADAAGHANNFGDKNQLILTADRLVPVFSYTHSEVTRTVNGVNFSVSRSGSGLSLLFGRDFAITESARNNTLEGLPINVHTLPRVSADYTPIAHLTIGASFAVGLGLGGADRDESDNNPNLRKFDAPRTTAIGFAPRVGYVIPLADIVAFWPRAGFAFYSVSTKLDRVNNNITSTVSLTDTILSLDLDPQLAIIPVEHFFFHVGPIINIPLSGSRSTKTTTGASTVSVTNDVSLFHFGITAGIGGWFNL